MSGRSMMKGIVPKSGTEVHISVTRRKPCLEVSSRRQRWVRSIRTTPVASVMRKHVRKLSAAPSCFETESVNGMSSAAASQMKTGPEALSTGSSR